MPRDTYFAGIIVRAFPAVLRAVRALPTRYLPITYDLLELKNRRYDR